MRSLSTVGLALSLVFGCLLLALLAELYYLLWWKKMVCRREIEDDDYISPSRELLLKFCLEKPFFFSSKPLNTQQVCSSTHIHEQQLWEGGGRVDDEFLRLQGFSGPPRYLFTIKEETKEDLEIEECRSRKGSSGRTLSDELFVSGEETPYMTPLASPPYYTPPLTPLDPTYKNIGFNPLFESSNEAEFCKLMSSPPPKFKFMKDAEDKLYRKKLMEITYNQSPSTSSMFLKDEENGSFITLIVAKDIKRKFCISDSSPPNVFASRDKIVHTKDS